MGDAASVKCFVVGCARSGTTLLSVLLDRHSDLAMTPETIFYGELAPSIDPSDPASVEDRLAGWRRLPELGLDARAVMQRCGSDLRPHRVFGAMLELYAERRGKPWCGEKSPMHRKFVHALARDFPEAKILHVLRDGRDVVSSLMSVPWWKGDVAQGASFWLDAVSDLERLEAALPGRFLVVDYQALVVRPAVVLERLMAFLALDFEPSQLDVTAPSGVVLERSLEWKGRALGAVDAGRVGQWRTLARPDRDLLDAAIRPRMAELASALRSESP